MKTTIKQGKTGKKEGRKIAQKDTQHKH